MILLAAVTGGLNIARTPKVITIELMPRGVIVEDYLYDYHTLESFWIDENHKLPQIIFQSKKHFMPHIIVPLGDIHHEDVRAFLLMHLKEVEHHESIGHMILEYFGF